MNLVNLKLFQSLVNKTREKDLKHSMIYISSQTISLQNSEDFKRAKVAQITQTDASCAPNNTIINAVMPRHSWDADLRAGEAQRTGFLSRTSDPPESSSHSDSLQKCRKKKKKARAKM